MATTTEISWCDSTFNPWEGCTKVGPGCDNCYAENRNHRFGGGNWGPGAPRRRTSEANWKNPLKWNRQHDEFMAEHGRRRRVFCASLADVFDNEVDPQWRFDLFALICATPNLDWLLLTKRIGNAEKMINSIAPSFDAMLDSNDRYKPLPNLWIGATVVNQEEADRDIPKLLQIPAAVRFLSIEPLLGPVDLNNVPHPWQAKGADFVKVQVFAKHPQDGGIHWIIAGGESGSNARPMQADWVRSLRDQCVASGAPFLFKQWGEWLPDNQNPAIEGTSGITQAIKVGKKAAGCAIDGREWHEFPSSHRHAGIVLDR